MREITQGVAAIPGEGKDIVQRAYTDRFAGARGRLDDILTRHLGPAENIVDYTNMLEENRAKAADPLYDAWRQTKVTPTHELRALMPRLEAAGAFTQARKIAGIEGESMTDAFPTGKFGSFDEYGPTGPPMTEKSLTAANWDMVKRGLDSKIDAAYKSGDKTEARALIKLKSELIGAVEKTPEGDIWRQGRAAFAKGSALIDQVAAGKDTFLGGREGLTADELREELRNLSGPERVARLVGLRSALKEDMGASVTGDARVGTRLLAPNNQEKIKLLLPQGRGERLIKEIEQEAFLRGRHPEVIGNPNTGASNITREESRNLFKPPEAPDFHIMHPGTFMPQNVLQDLLVAGRARSAPALAPILTTKGPAMQDLIDALVEERRKSAGRARVGSLLERRTGGIIAGPMTSTYRRYYENQKTE
jgi:hypothetical protein